MKNAAQILNFLLEATRGGERCALITITGVSGGSPRAVGTHMAVTEAGAHIGSISGGCVEAAIIGEAKRVIAAGRAEALRLGEGSPFIDIQLPCGGGIDILISPSPSAASLQDAAGCLADRNSVSLYLGQNGALSARRSHPGDQTGWNAETFQVRHDPDMELIVAGQGEEVLAFVRLGLAYNVGVKVLSPDGILNDAASKLGAQAWLLRAHQRSPHLITDAYSAVVLLFHDHDWELDLLAQALEQPAFFIGAMGSHTTQARRLRALAQRGVGPLSLTRLVGPIGLISEARDAETLALSAMAQIVSEYVKKQNQPVLSLVGATM